MTKNLEFSQATKSALDELMRALKNIYGVRLKDLYLYGSHARGEANRDSQ